jgi:Bacterial Ig domain/Bacterial TSP3 repeat
MLPRNHSLMAMAAGTMLASPAASAADSDGDGVPDDWELAHPGILSVWPPALNQTLLPYNTAPRSFLLNNATSSAVTYTATLSNNTVPLYSAVDSITGGVTYAWDEISATGTLLQTISNADDDSEPVAITGFAFPFYGINYSEVHVSSNGLLSFGYGNSSGGNDQIPGPGAPQNTIAAFWDDLDTRTTGTVYYKQEATRLIIQFQSVGRYGGGAGNYTFQAVLHSTGKIELRYKTMTGILNSASIGVEGADQTQGFGVVNNAAYVANSLALRFDTTSKFFSIATLAGSVPANTVGSLNGLFDSLSLPPGAYTANVSISHAGEGPSPLALTANLTVPDQPGAVDITSPATGSTAMQGTSVLIQTTATDPDGLEKVEFYDGTTKLGETPAYPGNDYYDFYWYLSDNGSRSITAKAIDLFGGVTLSSPVLFTATANNDFDGMPDSWEIANYLDPNDPYDGEVDADTDGYTNLEEYLFGTDPQIPEDTDYDGMPDGWEYHNGTDLNVADSSQDADTDGLTNIEEYWYGTNPNLADSDNDGLDDGLEVNQTLTSPTEKDSDFDELSDSYEVAHSLDPLNNSDATGDADLDGLSNLWEFRLGLNPRSTDSDSDSVSDALEDFDGDSLGTLAEIATHGSNPTQPDSDADGLNDGWEFIYGFPMMVDNWTDAIPANDPEADPDTDGLINSDEEQLGTHPNNGDTDGDGASDFAEAQGGSNPLNPASTPANPGGTPGGPANPPPPTIPVHVYFGDHSGSHSEKYKIILEPLEGDLNTQKRYRTNQNYGATQTSTFNLPAGAKYKITLEHLATDPNYHDDPKPDYDYTLSFTHGSTDTAIAAITEDPEGILDQHDESEAFFASGKSATLNIAWLTSETVAQTPVDRKRIKLGVGEEVYLKTKPPKDDATWTKTVGVLDSETGAEVTWTLKDDTGAATVTATYLGVVLTKNYTLYAPTGVDHADINATPSYPVGQASAGMHLYPVVVAPTDVSFYNVQMLEVGKPASNVTGYFITHPAISHVGHGADVWFDLDEKNQWPSNWDHANLTNWPSPWNQAGGFEWDIPAKWKVVNSTGTSPEHTITGWNQVFSIAVGGAITIQKFGHSVTRTTANVITSQ